MESLSEFLLWGRRKYTASLSAYLGDSIRQWWIQVKVTLGSKAASPRFHNACSFNFLGVSVWMRGSIQRVLEYSGFSIANHQGNGLPSTLGQNDRSAIALMTVGGSKGWQRFKWLEDSNGHSGFKGSYNKRFTSHYTLHSRLQDPVVLLC
jgi:hypothetical protein